MLQANLGIDYLMALDQKVRYFERVMLADNPLDPFSARHPAHLEKFSDAVKLTAEEVENVLRTIQEKELLFYPTDWNETFGIGFRVELAEQHRPKNHVVILSFLERQLPAGYDFNRLSGIFLTDENRERIEAAGLPAIVADRSHYNY